MQNNKHGPDRQTFARARTVLTMVLAGTLATTPIAQADGYYLARAIGEPPPALHNPTPAAPRRDPPPELPGLGTDARTATPPPSEGSTTTWKWVVGIALTAAVIALAKGGDKGGGNSAPSGGGSGGDRPPRLPELPDIDD